MKKIRLLYVVEIIDKHIFAIWNMYTWMSLPGSSEDKASVSGVWGEQYLPFPSVPCLVMGTGTQRRDPLIPPLDSFVMLVMPHSPVQCVSVGGTGAASCFVMQDTPVPEDILSLNRHNASCVLSVSSSIVFLLFLNTLRISYSLLIFLYNILSFRFVSYNPSK